MKKLITLALILSISTGVLASGNQGNDKDNCGVGQQTNGCGDDSGSNSSTGGNTSNIIHSNPYAISGGSTSNATLNNKLTNNNVNNINTSVSNSSNSDSSSSSSSRTNSSVTSNNGGNSVSGGDVNVSSDSYTNNRVAAASANAPNVAASGNNGVSGGVQTIFGGVSGGISIVDKSQKELNKANAQYAKAQAVSTLADSLIKLQLCTTENCKKAADIIVRKLGGN